MAPRKPKEEKAPDSLLRFQIDGNPYEIDLAKLTLGEKAEIASHFDRAYDALILDQVFLGAAYTAIKRKRPATEWADVEGITEDQFEDVEERPTQPLPGATGSPTSS